MTDLDRLAFGALFILGTTAFAAENADSLPRAALVLTAIENGTEPQSEFFCDGQIHGYIRLPGPVTGTHVLEGIWVLPKGKEIAHSRNKVVFEPPGRSTAYIWYAFRPRPGPFSGPDSESDAERQQYPGLWQVSARWDGELLVHSTFTVICR